MHGGAGALLSIGLLRAVDYDSMAACVESAFLEGGDSFISLCLWEVNWWLLVWRLTWRLIWRCAWQRYGSWGIAQRSHATLHHPVMHGCGGACPGSGSKHCTG